jgi:multiple sugar transport system permease protein
MSAEATTAAEANVTENQPRRKRGIDAGAVVLILLTIAGAILFAFPLYWALVTTLKSETEVVAPGVGLWPKVFTIDAYVHVLTRTKISIWYLNSLVTSGSVTLLVILSGATAGYALSQLQFPGRRVLYWMILASFMVPIPALIINHFVLMSQFKLLNSWLGIILPQLIHPVVILVYKQFFDSVPRDFREAAVIDGANHFHVLLRIYLPMNWGVTTALALITFIGAWNNFLWPFLAQTSENMMNVSVGITQVTDAFGVQYARELASAVLAGAPMAILYLIFQKRVTQAIMLSAGIKG